MDRLIQVRNTIGLDKEIFGVKCSYFHTHEFSSLTYLVIRFGAQKNRLIEAVLLNTRNKYFV